MNRAHVVTTLSNYAMQDHAYLSDPLDLCAGGWGLQALTGDPRGAEGASYAASWMRTSENTSSTTLVNKGK
jgi:hypothetical protein